MVVVVVNLHVCKVWGGPQLFVSLFTGEKEGQGKRGRKGELKIKKLEIRVERQSD